ncbi:kinase-like protein [Penicillium malachiteum]|nr:kinase-like protein [Penicillium malachiteum]
MDYIPGKQLDMGWHTLTDQQKISICYQLHGLKGSYIGAIDRGQAVIGKRKQKDGGPFFSEKQFKQFILDNDMIENCDLLQNHASFALTDDHDIVFTHGDLAPRDIFVEGDKVTGILDWEHAGWYPEYREYIKAFTILKSMPDGPEYLPTILPLRYERDIVACLSCP